MIVRITFLVIIKKILKWAENILSRNKLAGKKNTISKQENDLLQNVARMSKQEPLLVR